MRPITCLSFLILVAVGPPGFADEPKGDLAKLQGTWTTKVGPNNHPPATVTIQGSTAEVTFKNNEGVEIRSKGEVKVNDQASPKTIDWLKFKGPDTVDLADILSIYKLDGDAWTTCSGGPGRLRPTSFEAGAEGPPNLMSWTRLKDPAVDKPVAGDLGRFQGTWLAPAGPNDEVVVTMTVKVNAYIAKWDRGDGTNVELRGELRVNEKATPHKTIDFFKSERNDGDDSRDNLGLYEFDGDKIKVCLGGAGNERPTEFKKGSDGSPLLLTFTRKKD